MRNITFEEVKRVVAHGLWKKSRGKNPSASLGKERNPKRAFQKALEMSKNFNRHFHPERRSDEVFIANCNDDEFYDIGWVTKRRGDVAYEDSGQEQHHPFDPDRILDSLWFDRPVFVKMKEIESREKDYQIEIPILQELKPELV